MATAGEYFVISHICRKIGMRKLFTEHTKIPIYLYIFGPLTSLSTYTQFKNKIAVF